jgi:hypothetical protein
VPKIKGPLDDTNFQAYPDDKTKPIAVDKNSDPFLTW